MDERLLISLAEAHRLLRHDLNNRLQVILGYLQLNKPEKAQEYLFRTIQSLQRYNILSRIELPLLQAFLAGLMTKLIDNDSVLHIQYGNDMGEWRGHDAQLTRLFMDIFGSLEDSMISNELYCGISFSQQAENGIRVFLQNNAGGPPEAIKAASVCRSKQYEGLSIEFAAEENEGLYLTITRKEGDECGHDNTA